ncbi:hypothetical protein F7734_60265 [Scytonema sp. UIC 10036]|uniref:hypothetical protein n=1 Tax=Scytonema sp. UIC 10036 TaxID=2304196 RepID=UPI0012DAA6AB|nr:hypothetical protein [Scytonema sp. UIC 10036]MUH01859.1 hypothetical protein [Scytonema sp. UIC 10036]
MTKNQFTYLKYADWQVISNLLQWQNKIQDYLMEFYGADRNNILGTKFGDCASKSLELLEVARDERTKFRGVLNNNILQSGAIVEDRVGEIYLYEGQQHYVLLDIVCTAPWNCLPQTVSETCKGAAEWLIADIIQEITSSPNRVRGIFKVAAIPRAIEFYRRVGFEENPDGSREMILTEERALQFLQEHFIRWR